MNFKIIIIDDDEGILESLKHFLSKKYSVDVFTNVKEAIEKIRNGKFDLLILDYYLQETLGNEVVEVIRKFNKELYILLLTGNKEKSLGIETLENIDIQCFVEKSSNIKNILLNIESSIKSINFLKNIDSTDNNYSLASRIKELRKENSLSQEELAKHLNVTRGTIANYEGGVSEPSLDSIRKLALYFKVSTDYLLGLSTSRFLCIK